MVRQHTTRHGYHLSQRLCSFLQPLRAVMLHASSFAACSPRAYSQMAGLCASGRQPLELKAVQVEKLAEMPQMHSKDAMQMMTVMAVGDHAETQGSRQQNQNGVASRMASPTALWMKPNPMTPSKNGQSRRQGHNRIQGPSMISLEWPSGLWKPCSLAAALKLLLSSA